MDVLSTHLCEQAARFLEDGRPRVAFDVLSRNCANVAMIFLEKVGLQDPGLDILPGILHVTKLLVTILGNTTYELNISRSVAFLRSCAHLLEENDLMHATVQLGRWVSLLVPIMTNPEALKKIKNQLLLAKMQGKEVTIDGFEGKERPIKIGKYHMLVYLALILAGLSMWLLIMVFTSHFTSSNIIFSIIFGTCSYLVYKVSSVRKVREWLTNYYKLVRDKKKFKISILFLLSISVLLLPLSSTLEGYHVLGEWYYLAETNTLVSWLFDSRARTSPISPLLLISTILFILSIVVYMMATIFNSHEKIAIPFVLATVALLAITMLLFLNDMDIMFPKSSISATGTVYETWFNISFYLLLVAGAIIS